MLIDFSCTGFPQDPFHEQSAKFVTGETQQDTGAADLKDRQPDRPFAINLSSNGKADYRRAATDGNENRSCRDTKKEYESGLGSADSLSLDISCSEIMSNGVTPCPEAPNIVQPTEPLITQSQIDASGEYFDFIANFDEF